MNDFKVGDWVKPIYGKSFKQILEVDNSKALETFILIPEGLAPTWFNAKWFTKWQPKQGEWCWFYSAFWIDKQPILEQFSHMKDNKFRTKRGVLTMECEPFIGELPSFVKD